MIANSLLTDVAAEVASLADQLSRLGDALTTHLRERFPGVHFSICSDDDIPFRLSPVAGNEFCNLYYVDSREHCLKLTNDEESATGLVVAILDQES